MCTGVKLAYKDAWSTGRDRHCKILSQHMTMFLDQNKVTYEVVETL